MVARMATNTQIAESTLEHALALSTADLSAFDGVATSPFREPSAHSRCLADARP
jgi:hypothetical protein